MLLAARKTRFATLSMTDPITPALVENKPPVAASDQPGPVAVSEEILPLHKEEIAISRRRVETANVQVSTVTHNREAQVDEELTHERVEVERVPINRDVETVPPVREDGDTTIIPVVEEVVVVQRRLVLKEEVHVRRVRMTTRHQETVTLREQEAVITRTQDGVTSKL